MNQKDYTIQIQIPKQKYEKWKRYVNKNFSDMNIPMYRNITKINVAAMAFGMEELMKRPDYFRALAKKIKLFREC